MTRLFPENFIILVENIHCFCDSYISKPISHDQIQKYLHQKQNRELIKAVKDLIDSSPPVRLNKNLRRILLDYITSQSNALPFDFPLIINDISNLFSFLDFIDEHYISTER